MHILKFSPGPPLSDLEPMTMNLDHEAELIRQLPIFSRIDPAMRKLLCFAAEQVRVEPDQVLFSAGDDADAAYLVLSGALEISVPAAAGALRIGRIGANELIGEIGIFGDAPRTATATAATRVEALRIPKDVLQAVVRENPAAALQITRLLAQRLANTTSRLAATA
jgi:CRP-like cAMP-binding protein